jgi:acetylxylan esterase
MDQRVRTFCTACGKTDADWDVCSFGYSQTPASNKTIPGFGTNYSNATYGPNGNFQAILAQGVGHTVPVFENSILAFFGIA